MLVHDPEIDSGARHREDLPASTTSTPSTTSTRGEPATGCGSEPTAPMSDDGNSPLNFSHWTGTCGQPSGRLVTEWPGMPQSTQEHARCVPHRFKLPWIP